MKIKYIKRIISVAAFLLVFGLGAIIINGQAKLKHLDSSELTAENGFKGGDTFAPNYEDMSTSEMVTIMNGSIDGGTGEEIDAERAELEMALEDELERRYKEENERKRKEAGKILEARLAVEEKQRVEEGEMEKLIALASLPRVLPGESVSSPLASAALDMAMTQLGKPYVWGAVGPDTYDCSGLVLWAYNSLGYYDMPRTTRGQWTQGELIRQDQVQKGDLIYFLNNPLKTPVDHVGIYIGEGKMLHAPRPGKNVEITTVPWSRMVSIRRHFRDKKEKH